MRVVKSGDFYGVQEYLQQNKYFIFEYDPVFELFFLKTQINFRLNKLLFIGVPKEVTQEFALYYQNMELILMLLIWFDFNWIFLIKILFIGRKHAFILCFKRKESRNCWSKNISLIYRISHSQRLLFSKANPWSINNIDYKSVCDDGWSLKYLNKARQVFCLYDYKISYHSDFS